MSIKELIQQLQEYPNQDADVNFVVNMVDSEDDTFDVEDCDISFFQQDVDDAMSYDLFIHLNDKIKAKRNKYREDSIRNLLDKHRRLTIELDADALHKNNIVILNENEDVLREIEVGGRHYQHDNIIIMLQTIMG